MQGRRLPPARAAAPTWPVSRPSPRTSPASAPRPRVTCGTCLAEAQRVEGQTQFRVEALDREAAAERQHHTVDREADEAKVAAARGVKDRGARQEEVQAVLGEVLARCAGLKAAEGHLVAAAAPAEPRQGEEPAPALDVACVRTRVAARQAERATLEARWPRGAPRGRSGQRRPRGWTLREPHGTSGSWRTSAKSI